MFGKDKKKNYFYECFYDLGVCAEECFDTLSVGMKNFDANMDLLKFKNDVHKFEHEGDLKKEKFEEELAREFVTPIDREDIFLMLDKIDDLTDSIEEISYKMYLRNYKDLPPKTPMFIDEAKKCMDHLMIVLKNFSHVTEKDYIYPLIQQVLTDESDMDRLYENEVHSLYVTGKAYDRTRFDERIYGYFETITDKCKDVCKEVLIIMYKNL
ncbi:MAG: DUF47 family protein [Bacilli bacterium]